MQATEIMRRFDELGRIVVPKDIRRSLGVKEGDWMEMFIGENGELILCPHVTVPLTYENVRDTYEQMEKKDRLALIKSLQNHLEDEKF